MVRFSEGAAHRNAVHAKRHRGQHRIHLQLAVAGLIVWQMSVGDLFVPGHFKYAAHARAAVGGVRKVALTCTTGQVSSPEDLKVGDKVLGRVESYVAVHGAIVDLKASGLKGIIVNARMGRDRKEKMKHLLKLGDEAEFTVGKIRETTAHREFLGRSAGVELWVGDLPGKIPSEFSVGQLIKGKVTGCIKAAVFVDIGMFTDAIAKGAQAAVGDEVTVKVTAVEDRLGVEVELQ